jgi:hypothetical protein
MFRKALVIFVMVPILGAAMAAGTSFPVLFLMTSLLLIALMTPSRHGISDE